MRHYDVALKACPKTLIDKDAWNDFKNRIINRSDDEMTEAEKAKMQAIDESLTNLYGIVQDMKDSNKIYATVNDIPDWGKPVIQKLINDGVLHGDENGNVNIIEQTLKAFVVLNRKNVI